MLGSLCSFANGPLVSLLEPKEGRAIEGLNWGKIQLTTDQKENHSLPFVMISGVYDKKECNLLINSQKILIDENKNFQVKIQLSGVETVFYAVSVDMVGKVEKETRVILYPGWMGQNHGPDTEGSEIKTTPKFPFSLGFGFTNLSYKEDPVANFSEMALTAKGGYSASFNPTWNYGVSGYFTSLPLSSGSKTPIRFLGVNLRLGYVLTSVQSPWWVALMTGGYYTTTLVSGKQFGFNNLMGPQLFPVFRKTLNDKQSAQFYLKYSPVSAGGLGLSFSNREIATGGAFNFITEKNKLYSITLDLASLSLVVEGVPIQSNSLSLGGSVGF